jgi:hypothetical protein
MRLGFRLDLWQDIKTKILSGKDVIDILILAD